MEDQQQQQQQQLEQANAKVPVRIMKMIPATLAAQLEQDARGPSISMVHTTRARPRYTLHHYMDPLGELTCSPRAMPI